MRPAAIPAARPSTQEFPPTRSPRAAPPSNATRMATLRARRGGAEAGAAPADMKCGRRTRPLSSRSWGLSAAPRISPLTPTRTRASRCTTARLARDRADGWCLVGPALRRRRWRGSPISRVMFPRSRPARMNWAPSIATSEPGISAISCPEARELTARGRAGISSPAWAAIKGCLENSRGSAQDKGIEGLPAGRPFSFVRQRRRCQAASEYRGILPPLARMLCPKTPSSGQITC